MTNYTDKRNELDAAGLRSVCEALADVGAPDTMSATEAVYWLAERADKARSEALRKAADAWTQGGWSDVMLPKPTPPAVPVIAYSNRMGDWLRDRAEESDRD